MLRTRIWQLQLITLGILAFAAVVTTSSKAATINLKIKQNPVSAVNHNAVVNEADFFSQLDLNLPQLHLVKLAVDKKNWVLAKKEWGQYLQNRRSPHWLWSRRDTQKIRQVFSKEFTIDYYNKNADNFLARKFSFEGVSMQLIHDFNWRAGSPVWEQLLSRQDWMRDLGYAYTLTGKSVYAADFNGLILSWVQQHPVPPDVTKTWNTRDKAWMTLEVGLRMGNWMNVMESFLDAPEFTAEARYQMTRSLVEQMRYLDGWVVNYRIGNWQMAEATGMAYVGIMFPEFKAAAAWREKAFKFLAMHMERDVYADGTQVEVTPGYHSGVAEQCLDIARVLKANAYTIPGLLNKHQKMFDFILDISKPDRNYPPFGDARGGDGSQILGLGALFYNRPDMRWFGPKKANPNWIWTLGADAVDRYDNMKPEMPTIGSVLLPDSKYAMLRTGWKKDDLYFVLDGAPSLGAHSHGDRLQVLAYCGRDLLIDPGTISYADPRSEYFKTAKPHNILMIDGKEQEKVDPTIASWHTGAAFDYVAAKLSMKKMSHQRTLILVKAGYAIVVDRLESEDEHTYTRQFQFPLGSNAKANSVSAVTNFVDGINILVYPAESTSIEMHQMPVPVSSNTTREAPQASFTNKGKSLTLATVLFPFNTTNDLPKIEQIANAAGIIALQLTFPDGHADKIAVSAVETDLKIGQFSSRGTILYVRKNKNGQEEIIK